MTLLAPIFLWTFAALIPLALIYLLKVRPRKKPTTAFFLWQKVITPDRRSALFQRLRDIFSLLLMALAFGLIALALTEPELAGDERKNLVLIIDQSASMQAREGTQTRYELAHQRARDVIRGLRGAQQASVAGIAHELSFAAHLTRHQRSLLEAVDKLKATDMPLDADALASFIATGSAQQNSRVLFITDGCSASMERLPKSCEVLRVGSTQPNVGIVAGDLRKATGEVIGLRLFLRLRSSFSDVQKTELNLTHEDTKRLVKVMPLELKPNAETPVTVDLADAPAGRYIAELSIKDALDLDNRAHLVMPQPEPITVAVSSSEPFFYSQAVRAFEQGDQSLQLTDDEAKAEIVIATRNESKRPRTIIFQPEGKSEWWTDIGDVVKETIVPRWKNRTHPLGRFLDAESMDFTGARHLKAPPGSLVLVESEEGVPLIYLARQPDKAAVVVNLDPAESAFYLSAWFPVLVNNAARLLGGREDDLPSIIATGSALPKGVASSAGFFFNDDPLWVTGVSLFNEAESNLDNTALKETAQPLSQGRPWSYWLALVALGLVTAESLLYHRRKVG